MDIKIKYIKKISKISYYGLKMHNFAPNCINFLTKTLSHDEM